MDARDKALEDMMKMEPWEVITQRHSKGSIYRAWGEFEKKVAERIANLNNEIANLVKTKAQNELELKSAAENYTSKLTELSRLEERISELESKITALKKNKEEVEIAVASANENLNNIQTKLMDLVNRGIDDEILDVIIQSDAEPEELLVRVQTAQRYQELINEARIQKNNFDQLINKIEGESEKLSEIQENINSENNIFDELRTRNYQWQEAIELTVTAYQKGYDSDILKGIIEELFRLSISGQPTRSANRLLTRLRKIDEEVELDESIARKTAQLGALEQKFSVLEAAAETIGNQVLGSIKTLEKDAVHNIKTVAEASRESISDVADQTNQYLDGVKQIGCQSLQDLTDSGLGALKEQQRELFKNFNDNRFAIKLSLQSITEDIQSWGNVREQAGKYSNLIQLATILFGVQQNPDAVLALEPAMVTTLAERINHYVCKKWPGVKTKAPRELSSQDWGVSSVYEANLTSLTKWLVAALRGLERGIQQ